MSAPPPSSVLLPYQQRWLADRRPVKVCEKSRRVGLSWGEACDDALTAAQAAGCDAWYIGYSKDMALEWIRDVATWSRHFQLAASAIDEVVLADEDKDIAAYRVVYDSRQRVTALSSRPTNLRGKQGTVIIDEAAFHDNLGGLLKAALALLMWGGKVRIISTHNGEENDFNALLQDCRSGKRPYSVHRITLDDALEDGLYQRICLMQGLAWSLEAEQAWRDQLLTEYGDDADEELFCIPASGGGGYLPRAVIQACMRTDLPVVRLAKPDSFATAPEAERQGEIAIWCAEVLGPLLADLPRHAQHYLGEDFGRSGDLTVLAPLTELENLTYQTPFLLELRNVPFEQQKQIVFYLADRLPNLRRAAFDMRGNGQYLSEVSLQRYGPAVVMQVALSESWYREHMPPFKRGLEERALAIPQHSDVLLDLRALAMTKGVAKVPEGKRYKGADGKDRHGDAAMALVMAWHAAHAEGAPAAGTLTATPAQTFHAARSSGRRRLW